MNDKNDELLARIKNADPAANQLTPLLELPATKPTRKVRAYYLAPLALVATVALVLSIGNSSPLIVANADQMSEYKQAMNNYGYLQDLEKLMPHQNITPEPTKSPGNESSIAEQPTPSEPPTTQVLPTLEVTNYAGIPGFIKPGEIYRAKIAADFDSRFNVYQSIFGPTTQKFTYGNLGGFKYINSNPTENANCNEMEGRSTGPNPSVVAILKRYADAENINFGNLVFNYLDLYSTAPHSDIYCGSWIEIYDVVNGALRESAVQIQTDSAGIVKSAGGLISDYEVMATEKLLSPQDTLNEAARSEIDWVETSLNKGIRFENPSPSRKAIKAVPMYTRIYSENGDEWYVPSYLFVYWNGGMYRGMAVDTNLVKWKQN
jgi:hypothetical protein